MSKTSKDFQFLGFEISQESLKSNWLWLAGVILGFVLVITGLASQFLPTKSKSQIEIVPENKQSATGEIVVDVAGAVVSPGVYKLAPDSRVGTAIQQAGGLSSKADLAWLAKNLNLAAKISDGAKIYIPAKGDSATISTQGSQVITNSGKVNINSATQSQLEALPAIGPVTAGKIIQGRSYNSVDDLLAKKVIGKSTFDKIKDLISVF